MHSLLIYNPVSGKKELRTERLGKIVSELTQHGNEVTVYQTQEEGDAQHYLEEICRTTYDRVVCCGGDGTLHEVINGIVKKQWDVPIGYIPMGSTNDYAKNLGITRNSAMKCLEDGAMSAIDIGCINGEYFNYVAAFGMLTNVSFATPQELKNTFGYFAYLLEGVKQLTDITSRRIRFCVDEVWTECDVILGMITNSFSVAGIKNFKKKNIKLDDGMLEYLFIKYPKNVMELQTIISTLLSGKTDERYMYYGQFSLMQIESEPMEWTLDGENGGVKTSAEITINSGAIKIIHKK